MTKTLARFCDAHPDRPAIGVCVITRQAICAECSTQYQGVNYSKRGLEQYLAQQRGAVEKKQRGYLGTVVLWVLLPLAGYLAWQGFDVFGQGLIDLMQMDDVYDGGTW